MFATWYDKHIAARWYASSAMWVGIAAGLVEYLPDLIQMGLDNFDLLGGVFALEDTTKRRFQALLLFVVLPICKAWRQRKSQAAALVQAARTGVISSPKSSDMLLIDVPGVDATIVRPADANATISGV